MLNFLELVRVVGLFVLALLMYGASLKDKDKDLKKSNYLSQLKWNGDSVYSLTLICRSIKSGQGPIT
jgi:hypothetical protein